MHERAPVVAAVDLSEISPAVVRCAARLAERLGAELTVFHALDAVPSGGAAGLLPPLRRLASKARDEAEASLAALVADLGLAARPRVSTQVGGGEAETAVADLARCSGAQLVVVGAPHPHVIGNSAAERLVSRCGCPVLVIRHPPAAGYRKVVAGVDFSAEAGRAWQAAAHLAEEDAVLLACHVREQGEGDTEVETAMERWLKPRSGTERVLRLTELGSPATALPRVAAREGAELLAVGRGARRHVTGALLGSVAARMVAAAPCDVLVAGAPPDDGETP